jgi:hypothetical protein
VKPFAAILAGGLLLIWPAALNHYPIVFSDTGAFLAQTVVPLMIWDKPWIYGPLAFLAHGHVSLWGVVLAQGLIVSHLLWLLARVVETASPARHLLLCGALAVLSTAPWSAALVMPDILTPVAVLCAALIGWGADRLSRGEFGWLVILGALATAAHLSNLPVIFAIMMLALLLGRWRAALRMAAPLLGAVLLLLGTNLIGHGRLALSPYGSTFFLARLIADGPAARTIAARCPDAGWYLCAFAGRLPDNSDVFLWEPDSPVNRAPDGTPIRLGGMQLAPEARAIIAETLWREPGRVTLLAFGNFARQITLTRIGDTLGSAHVGVAVRPRIEQGFPPFELSAFDAALQQRDALAPLAGRIAWLHPPVLALAVPVALLALWQAHRARDARRFGLVLALLAGVLANAFVTGALSMPHHRYQARIAWLVLVAATLLWRPAAQAPGRS